VIGIPIHDNDFHTRVSDEPLIPGSTRADSPERMWALYEDVLKWIASKEDINVIGINALLDMIVDDRNRMVTQDMLCEAAQTVLKSPSCPPDYIDLGDDYLSLTDCFQAFAFNLKEYNSWGTPPFNVEVNDILGPTEYRGIEKPAGTMKLPSNVEGPRGAQRGTVDIPVNEIPTTPKPQVVELKLTGEEIITLAGTLNLTYEVPASVMIRGKEYHPGVFLYLMAAVIDNIFSTGNPGQVSFQGAMNVLPPHTQKNVSADALTKLQFWSYKPYRFNSNLSSLKR